MTRPRGEGRHRAGPSFGRGFPFDRFFRKGRFALCDGPADRFQTELFDGLIGEQMRLEAGVGRRTTQHDRPLDRRSYEIGATLLNRDDFGDGRECSSGKSLAAANAMDHANKRILRVPMEEFPGGPPDFLSVVSARAALIEGQSETVDIRLITETTVLTCHGLLEGDWQLLSCGSRTRNAEDASPH